MSNDPETLARKLRAHVVRMTHTARTSHVGSNLSVIDILAVLYCRILKVNPADPAWVDRDRLVFSKGHAAASLYAALAERGFFPLSELDRFCRAGSPLCGHVSTHGVPGVDAATGSLGHGLSIATGMALAAKRDGRPSRVFAILSDGECDEGSTWEPALFAPHHALDNLVVVVDYNKIQSLGLVETTLALEPFAEKWRAFGWSVREVDGHDLGEIEDVLSAVPLETGRPTCVIAHTIKGKGVSFMENDVLWHYRPPSEDELTAALAELGET